MRDSFDIKGNGIDKNGEIVYSGRDITVRLLGGLGDETIYRLPVPDKNKRFLKPEKIERHLAIPSKALLISGVYHRMYKAVNAIDILGWNKDEGKASVARWSGAASSFWPEDYDRMMAYDVVVLSNVDAGAIGAEGVEMLREYVKNGGALLVLGGPFAFTSETLATGFSKLLPVEFKGMGNLIQVKNGKLRSTEKALEISKGLDFKNGPACFWLHDLKPQKGSNVILVSGDSPLMVIGNYGKGRVAVFLGSPLGEGKNGELSFWAWEKWPNYLSQVIKYLCGKK